MLVRDARHDHPGDAAGAAQSAGQRQACRLACRGARVPAGAGSAAAGGRAHPRPAPPAQRRPVQTRRPARSGLCRAAEWRRRAPSADACGGRRAAAGRPVRRVGRAARGAQRAGEPLTCRCLAVRARHALLQCPLAASLPGTPRVQRPPCCLASLPWGLRSARLAHLVPSPRVNAQPHVQLHCLVKLGPGQRLHRLDGLLQAARSRGAARAGRWRRPASKVGPVHAACKHLEPGGLPPCPRSAALAVSCSLPQTSQKSPGIWHGRAGAARTRAAAAHQPCQVEHACSRHAWRECAGWTTSRYARA